MPSFKHFATSSTTVLATCSLSLSPRVAAQSPNASFAVLPITAGYYGNTPNVDVTLGAPTFRVLVDTGSADLWVLGNDWKCTREKTRLRSDCEFGNATYSPSRSSTYAPVDYAWLGEHYGNGDVIGPLATEQLGLGDITVPDQIFGIINSSTTVGDKLNTGLMGLGYPILAQAHPINYTQTSSAALLQSRLAYSTVFWHMIDRGVAPYFALALERLPLLQETGAGGFLSFGTLPPVPHGPFVTTPVEVTKAIPRSFTNGKSQISFWTTTVQSVSWSHYTDYQPFQAIVDSGNWLNVFPPKVANGINAGFSPAGKLDKATGYFAVACDAIPPANVAFQIANTTFSINSADMMWRDWDGSCYSTVEAAETALGVEIAFLGVAFLKNVVAVFDVGKSEMRFASRTNTTGYGSPSVVPATSGARSSLGAIMPLSAALGLLVVLMLM